MNYSDTHPTQASIEQDNDRAERSLTWPVSQETKDAVWEALRAKEAAEAVAKVARDNYVAATLGYSRYESGYVAEAAYIQQRMFQAALTYAEAADKAAEALERYEAL